MWAHFDIDPNDKEFAICQYCSHRLKRGGGCTSSMTKHMNRYHHTFLVASGAAAGETQTTMDGKVVKSPNFQRDALFWMLMTYEVRRRGFLLVDFGAQVFFVTYICTMKTI